MSNFNLLNYSKFVLTYQSEESEAKVSKSCIKINSNFNDKKSRFYPILLLHLLNFTDFLNILFLRKNWRKVKNNTWIWSCESESANLKLPIWSCRTEVAVRGLFRVRVNWIAITIDKELHFWMGVFLGMIPSWFLVSTSLLRDVSGTVLESVRTSVQLKIV